MLSKAFGYFYGGYRFVESRYAAVPEKRQREVFLLVSFIAFVLSALFVAFLYGWGDLANYYRDINLILDDGLVPYRDFDFEYPPLALPFLLLPALLSFSEDSYCVAYMAIAYLAYLLASYLTVRAAKGLGMSPARVRILLLVAFSISNFFVIARFDIYAVLFVTAAVLMFVEGRNVPAFAFLGIAAMTKIYPILLIPVFMAVLAGRSRWKDAFAGLLVSAAVCFLIEVPFILSDPSTAFSYLTYHSDRGIQLESVAAGFIMLGTLLFGSDVEVVHNFGSENLTGYLPDHMAPFMNMVMIVAAMAVIVAALVCMRTGRAKTDGSVLPLLSALTIMVMVIFSKVYSAQYTLWFVMLVPLVLGTGLPKADWGRMFAILLLFGFFQAIDGLALYYAMTHMEMWGVVDCVAKNVLLIALAAEFLRLLFPIKKRKTRSVPC